MAALVAAERHLWLTLSDMKEKDRVFLMDAPLAPSGLFGDAINSVVDRYQEARQEKCAFSITEDHLSGRGVGFDHDAGTSVSCSDRVDPYCSRESQRRPVTHCQAVSEDAGSDGSYVQHDTFGLLYMRPLQWWLKTKGFSLRGNPLRMIKVTRRCLRHVEKTLVLVSGPGAGSSLSDTSTAWRCWPCFEHSNTFFHT